MSQISSFVLLLLMAILNVKMMDKIFNFSLESALIALTNTEDLKNLMDENIPYLEKHRHKLKECLENGNCAQVGKLLTNIGTPYSIHSKDQIFLSVSSGEGFVESSHPGQLKRRYDLGREFGIHELVCRCGEPFQSFFVR